MLISTFIWKLKKKHFSLLMPIFRTTLLKKFQKKNTVHSFLPIAKEMSVLRLEVQKVSFSQSFTEVSWPITNVLGISSLFMVTVFCSSILAFTIDVKSCNEIQNMFFNNTLSIYSLIQISEIDSVLLDEMFHQNASSLPYFWNMKNK